MAPRPITAGELRRLVRDGLPHPFLPEAVVALSYPSPLSVADDEPATLTVEVRGADLEGMPEQVTAKVRPLFSDETVEVTIPLVVKQHDGSIDRDYKGSPFS